MAKSHPTGLFPSQSVSNAEKASLEYGQKIGRAIESEWFKKDSGTSRYQSNRENFHRLRLYARGEQSIQKYKDELSINGDLSYLNLDWKPVPIIPKFVDIVVNGIAERMYDIKAYSQDPHSTQARTNYMENILRDMKAKEYIDTVQEVLGVNTYNTDPKKLPVDETELSVHMQLDYKQSIEIAQEEALSNVFDLNKYEPKVIVLELINKKNNSFHEQEIKDIQKSKIYKYMIKKNYKLANWIHDDLIFVSKKFIKKR